MTSSEFTKKWSGVTTTERAAAQEHFIDICRMLGVKTPNEADPNGTWYAFEKGTDKTTGGSGFADVWMSKHFAWEYKGKRKDLQKAYEQLLLYREALNNPPILVVSDLDRFEVHTNFTNTPKKVYTFNLEDIARNPKEPLRILRAVFTEPVTLKPDETRDDLTKQAASEFAELAARITERGNDAQRTAHFLNKLLFCLFAEDAGLLPRDMVERIVTATDFDSASSDEAFKLLFRQMSESGGMFGVERIQWFNGGLFDGDDTIPLTPDELRIVARVAKLDWAEIEPAIFGTLFERGLDPSKRQQLGAHYTDRASIERVVGPVLIDPFRRELEEAKAEAAATGAHAEISRRTRRVKKSSISPAFRRYESLLKKIRKTQILDPACGSGNFLYVALQSLKDIEKEVTQWGSEAFSLPIELPEVSPANVRGIELNPYAAELARVVIWIGEIQWMLDNGFAYRTNPILEKLDSIECRDALLCKSDTGVTEATWPAADVIIGNPPFLGAKFLRAHLGNAYVEQLFTVYGGRVPGMADLCCYWFEKAREAISSSRTQRAGLLATQGIRGGHSRRVLDRIKISGDIFMAWSDEPWVVEGAAVHVSIIGFDDGSDKDRHLNESAVEGIASDLRPGIDLTKARRLKENSKIAFIADVKGGPFDISPRLASAMIAKPNPHDRPNSDVVKPWVNGRDITQRSRGMWIIDFGVDMSEEDASLYEAPFEYVREHVKPARDKVQRARYRERWWLHSEPCSGMRNAIAGLPRFLVTPALSKHRIFRWVNAGTLPDHQLIVVGSSEDYTFGILHSWIHECWSRARGTQLRERESGFRYTPTSTFETFPFPTEVNESTRAEISALGRRLNELREGWLNPESESEQRSRTLTNLYNAYPTWLEKAHAELDAAVYRAYGWTYQLSNEEILERLYALNLARPSIGD